MGVEKRHGWGCISFRYRRIIEHNYKHVCMPTWDDDRKHGIGFLRHQIGKAATLDSIAYSTRRDMGAHRFKKGSATAQKFPIGCFTL